MKPGARFFCHTFCHHTLPYHFEVQLLHALCSQLYGVYAHASDCSERSRIACLFDFSLAVLHGQVRWPTLIYFWLQSLRQ